LGVEPTPAVFSPAEERAMRQALDQAQNAWLVGEVPVGAVILRDDADGVPQVVATGYNRPITTTDPTAHAELVALRHAAQLLDNYRLPDCTLVVTLEPCAMCAMALIHARLKRVVFGARDPKTGAAGSVLNLFELSQLNHQTRVAGGCLEAECGTLLRDFFVERRAAHKARQAALRPQAEAEPATIPVADVTVDDAIPVGLAIEIDPLFPDPPDARGAPQ
jgi:tRNA(adenine34) deaminase